MQHSTAHSKAKAAAPRLTPRESLCVCCSSLSDGVIKYKELHKLLIRSVHAPEVGAVSDTSGQCQATNGERGQGDANTLCIGIFVGEASSIEQEPQERW